MDQVLHRLGTPPGPAALEIEQPLDAKKIGPRSVISVSIAR